MPFSRVSRPVLTNGRLSWGDKTCATGADSTLLLRFHDTTRGTHISARALLDGDSQVSERAHGPIVVLTLSVEARGGEGMKTPIGAYDAGEDGSVAYLAMEYFQDKPLSHCAQQGQLLPLKTARELMARAAEGLNYAHGQHVVHRDIKPANMMYDRGTDSFKITDFGIARLTDTSRTKTGIILGTPSYMSPEQLAGTNVTGQSDLFSLGITPYQRLNGYAPLRADSIPKLMQEIAHERHESVRLMRDELPRSVDSLPDQALATGPADRFPSWRSMATALPECGASLGAAAAS